MNGLMYTSTGLAAALATARDLFALTGTAENMVVIHSVRIGQTSEEGDASAQMLQVKIMRSAAAGAGTANTPVPHMLGAPAASSTIVTDAAVATPTVTLINDAFNLQAGWLYLPTPEERIVVSGTAANDVIVVNVASPASTPNFEYSLTFEEILG